MLPFLPANLFLKRYLAKISKNHAIRFATLQLRLWSSTVYKKFPLGIFSKDDVQGPYVLFISGIFSFHKLKNTRSRSVYKIKGEKKMLT